MNTNRFTPERKNHGAIHFMIGLASALTLVLLALNYKSEIKNTVSDVEPIAKHSSNQPSVIILAENSTPSPPETPQPETKTPEIMEDIRTTEEPMTNNEPNQSTNTETIVIDKNLVTSRSLPTFEHKKGKKLPVAKIIPCEKCDEEAKPVTFTSVSKMAIYPGCEKEEHKGKQALVQCMSNQLSRELSYELSDFACTAQQNGIENAAAKVKFIVNTEGEIEEIELIAENNFLFGKASEKAMLEHARRMIKKSKRITPAEFEDGRKANLIFSLPLRFETQN